MTVQVKPCHTGAGIHTWATLHSWWLHVKLHVHALLHQSENSLYFYRTGRSEELSSLLQPQWRASTSEDWEVRDWSASIFTSVLWKHLVHGKRMSDYWASSVFTKHRLYFGSTESFFTLRSKETSTNWRNIFKNHEFASNRWVLNCICCVDRFAFVSIWNMQKRGGQQKLISPRAATALGDKGHYVSMTCDLKSKFHTPIP